MKNIVATLAGMVCALLMFAGMGASTAQAAPLGGPPDQSTSADTGQASITTDDIAYVRAQLASYGVDQATQDSLVDKLVSGVLWQSMTPGASPIRTTSSVVDNESVTIATYSDGSVLVTRTSLPVLVGGGLIQPLGISGCVGSGSTGYEHNYTGCKAEVSIVVATLGFSFSLNPPMLAVMSGTPGVRWQSRRREGRLDVCRASSGQPACRRGAAQ